MHPSRVEGSHLSSGSWVLRFYWKLHLVTHGLSERLSQIGASCPKKGASGSGSEGRIKTLWKKKEPRMCAFMVCGEAHA